jgi:uncharacterized protein GlcG (DUF336 family)
MPHRSFTFLRHGGIWVSRSAIVMAAAATLARPAPSAAQPVGQAAPAAQAAQAASSTATAAYGVPIGLDRAREIIARARFEAQRNLWAMAIAHVDTGGRLVAERMDKTQTLSIQIAVDKARTASGLRRSTKALEEAVGAGRTAILSLPGVVAVEGGLPIVVNGLVVGAIGVRGASSAQDDQVAAAALGGP